MDTKLFREWYTAVRPGKEGMELFPFLNQYEGADDLLEQALLGKKPAAWVLARMRVRGALVPLVPEARAEMPTETPEEAPAEMPAEEKPIKKTIEKADWLKNKKVLVIGGLIVAALAVFIAGYFIFFSGNTGNDEVSYDLGAPMVYYENNTRTVTETPVVGQTAVPGGEVTPPQLLIPKQPDPWFVKAFDVKAEREAFLVKPKNFLDFFQNFPWRWVLWLLFLSPLWSLLRQDRFAAQERTDVRSSRNGLIALFVGVIGAGLMVALVKYLLVTFGTTAIVPTWPFVFTGVVTNLIVQWNASMSGRRDYSAFSIAGLFMTGAVLIWWFTANVPVVVLGAVLMAAGIWMQGIEMSRTHQGGKAIFTALIMLIIFVSMMALWYNLAGLVVLVPRTSVPVMTILYFLLFKSRFFLGAIFGMMIAYFVGDQLSEKIMPPQFANGTLFKGSQTPESEHDVHRHGEPDDFEGKWDVNSRFDAMAYMIMILYPLAAAAWYIGIAFLLF